MKIKQVELFFNGSYDHRAAKVPSLCFSVELVFVFSLSDSSVLFIASRISLQLL